MFYKNRHDSVYMGEFDFFFQYFWDAKTFPAVVFINTIYETVAVLKSESFKRRWVNFSVL